jgi:hypothetical protein
VESEADKFGVPTNIVLVTKYIPNIRGLLSASNKGCSVIPNAAENAVFQWVVNVSVRTQKIKKIKMQFFSGLQMQL